MPPILQDLKKKSSFQWNDESEAAFQQLKKYLSSPLLLIVPITGEELIVYLSILPIAISAVLIQEEEKIQKIVYNVSKVLMDVETRQNPDEDLAKWKLFVDGSSNQHGYGARLVL